MKLGNDWIHNVYGCANGEYPWDVALRPLIGALNASCAGVVLHSIEPVSAEVLVRIDVNQNTENAYVGRYVRENPVMNCLSAMPLGYVTTGSGAVDEQFYFNSSFYKQWQKPAGYADNMGIALARRNGQFVLLSLPRNFDAGTYSREDVSAIVPYVQHLVRAFNIWLRLNMAEPQTEWVSEAMDQVAQGLIILGEERVILYANKGGERILDRKSPLARVNFRLRVTKPGVAGPIDEILRLFEAGEASDSEEYSLTLPREDGQSPLFLRVQPPLGLRPGQRNLGLPKAVAFLHVVDPDERRLIDLKPFGEGYGLTPAQVRMAEAVARTESIIEAARMLGISEATARSHIQGIYAKTGTGSLAALVGAMYRTALK